MIARLVKISLFFLVLTAGTWRTESGTDYDRYWPQWRGPTANGVAPHGNPPIKWDENTNIRWKIPVPGKGLSTPVIWGDQIFLSTAIETDRGIDPEKTEEQEEKLPQWRRRMGRAPSNIHQFVVLSINRKDGSLLWQRTVREALPHAGTHKDGSWASNSPVTDGEHVFAYFGSNGLYCFDLKGNILWEHDFGDMNTRASFGEGSSPVLYKDKLIVNWDHEDDSFIIVLDKKTGKEIWKMARDEATSWSTPLVVEIDQKPQIVVSASGYTRGYDLATGAVIWKSSGLTLNVIPSPVYAEGVVYVMSGFRGSALQAIRLKGASGEIDDSDAILWRHDKDTPYTPSPLLYKDLLYFLKINKEELSCFNALTGEPYYQTQKLENIKGVYASPVGAADRVYIAGRNGVTYVIEHGPDFEILAENHLDDKFDASPVIVDRELYLRGIQSLYCISQD